MKLHPIVHSNDSILWCGPAAIASIVGLDSKTVHECIRDVCHLKSVTGMSNAQVQKTLKALGYASRCYRSLGRWLTLEDWAKKYRHVFAERAAIVTVVNLKMNHYVVLLGSRFIDNSLNRSVHISKSRHKRARVLGFILVEKV